MRRQIKIIAALLVFVFHQKSSSHQVVGFQPFPNKSSPQKLYRNANNKPQYVSVIVWNKSKLFGPDDDDIGDGEGEALARQFYDQMRQREIQPPPSSSSSLPNDTDKDDASRSSMGNDNNSPPAPAKKFTGKVGPEPAPFSPNNNNDSRRSPREQMMEREFQLVGRAERGLKFQAIFAACVLCFYLYVGATGGIQSGDDLAAAAGTWDLGADESILEETIPVPRDAETSYWL